MTRDQVLQWAAQELAHREGMVDARKLLGLLDTFFESEELTKAGFAALKEMVAKRQSGMPMAQILGYRDFWKDRFKVTESVLDPRPETEHLIETVIELCNPKTILDLGTGSGCIALSLAREFPEANISATDVSEQALSVAKENWELLELSAQVRFVQSDWFENVSGQFDLIVSNPPYIAKAELADLDMEVLAHEPLSALSPGDDGLVAYRFIFSDAASYLEPDGLIVLEHGWQQADPLLQLAAKFDFYRVKLVKDLSGKDRITAFSRK